MRVYNTTISKYRSPNLSTEEEYILLEQLYKVFFKSDKYENIVMVKDFNLPNVDWMNGLVVSSINSICQHSRIKKKQTFTFVYNKWNV